MSEEYSSHTLLVEKFKSDYLLQKFYYRHSDIDIYVNIIITELLNYNLLLSEEAKNFLQENFVNNYKYWNEIMSQKQQALDKKQFDKSILSFEIPEFEIYFVAKLYIDGMERKPECQTKLLFNSKNINQYISMRFKYKDLTTDSYIDLELYSMQLKKDKNLLGKTRIYLFDEKMNLNQGRHIFKLIKNKKNEIINEDLLELNEVENEIDLLINNYYSHMDEDSKNIKHNYLKENDKLNLNDYFYNSSKKTLEIKPDSMKYFENALNELLSKTNNTFVVIKFPSFPNTVIYEEDISEDYHLVFTPELPLAEKNLPFKNWINDPYINLAREDFNNKDNPISEKFSSLMRENDNDEDLFARDIRLNPVDMHKITKLLNTPDFIKLDNNDVALFWNYRYYLLNNTNYSKALTKIMNSVKWGNLKSENEFIKNILKHWNKIEISDILFMLSRKFSVNNLYPNTDIILNNNFEGMKKLRKFAVTKLEEHSNEELNFILLQLVQAIRYEDISVKNINSPLVSFLIRTCSKDEILASSFYWFIECEADNDISSINTKNKNININNLKDIIKIYDLIREKFSQNLRENYPKINEIIDNEKTFKNELVKISESLTKVQKNENKKKELRNILANKNKVIQEEYYLPIDPHIKIKGTVTEQCSVFKSAKCPVKYTFKVQEDTQKYNPHEEKEYMNIMFKYGDDLRQDQLILQMINFMDSLLKKVHLNYEFTSYKVLATSKSDGFVEFVPNSRTIFDILKKYNNVIMSYYKEISGNDETILKKYLDSYINSCAGYCVVTYILGIGDRHLENLMIDNRGRLFHIDFGFILGKDPKPAPPPIKLCQEMVDVMGGKGSSQYEEFKQKCVNAYWVLRENARVIVNMFYLMIDSGIPELNDIENLYKLHEKFVPGFSKQDASISFLTNLEESVNALMPILMEKFHAWAQYWK
jgi:phosphatidylinositol 3-kinase